MLKSTAKLISVVFEPYTVATVTTLLVFFKVQAATESKLVWLGIGFLVGALPPLIILIYEKSKGKISDWFMSSRAERRDVQLAWVFGAAIFTSLALVYGLPRLILALSLSFFTLSFLVTAINFYWKISVHTAMISLAVLALVLTYSSLLAGAVLLILLVAWARVQLGAHTWSQVSGGALLAILVVYFWFNFFGLATF